VNQNYTDTGTTEDKKNRDTGTIKGNQGQTSKETFFKEHFLSYPQLGPSEAGGSGSPNNFVICKHVNVHLIKTLLLYKSYENQLQKSKSI
jgi:hypothetical protein